MEFFKISHDIGKDIKVIFANNKFEAVGFYILEANKDNWIESLDKIEVLPSNHKIEVSCVGFPIFKTVQEIYMKENKDLPIPCLVCGLID